MSGICAVKKDDTFYVFDEIMLTRRRNHLGFCGRSHPQIWGGSSRYCLSRPNGRSAENQRCRRNGPHNPPPQRLYRPKPQITVEDPRQDHSRQHSANGRSGTRRTHIHPRCKELIKSLRTLTYAPGTGLPNKNLGVDHAFDAFGYLVLQQFNLAKPEAMGTTTYRLY